MDLADPRGQGRPKGSPNQAPRAGKPRKIEKILKFENFSNFEAFPDLIRENPRIKFFGSVGQIGPSYISLAAKTPTAPNGR